jgi:DNA-binding CsgD family transcriptional regulator
MRTALDDFDDEDVRVRLYTAAEIGELMGISARKVLMLPIKQVRLGTRTIRYKLTDVYAYIGVDNSNL